MSGLDVPLSPLRFLDRAATVFPDKVAVIDGKRQFTYAELAAHVTRLAQAVRASGATRGGRIAYISSNSVEMLAAHFAIPLAGNVLVAINTRLAAPEIQYICDHSETDILFAEGTQLQRLGLQTNDFRTVREIVELPDADGSDIGLWSATPYAAVMARGNDTPLPWHVADEEETISINYTSGTTGRPKGVMYTHRGAYLNALNQIVHNSFNQDTRYLWTLPMFHCNGWCHPWAVTAASGVHVCLRAVRAQAMWHAIDRHSITHLSGAPVVLTTLTNAPEAHRLANPIAITTAGAPPSPTTVAAVRALGATVTHVYGLTETYGPYSICETQPTWRDLDEADLAARIARQGVGMLCSEHMRVVRPTPADGTETLLDVRPDGVEMGEIVMRGNIVMKGYYRDPEQTKRAFAGGWFHSGDLGVRHPDGYVQLFDRSKDVIVSGGENISSVEVEQALMAHPAVIEVAVIGVPDTVWGERPKAFVVADSSEVTAGQLIEHVKTHLASYKVPRDVEFVDELPKTSTGKTLKGELRAAEWDNATVRIQG
ncbi:AMP-binding protein [Mycolicibacterium goodii]|uniref:AMP-binding protein n=1 Tax=Mycolicibacterium goodii TaxID=134601 RepID=UPI000C26B0CE|nr:AMP-binding protein [Mycolicibacterium goodii]PJK22472.1 acyl-CoA synthetase [Mycolicibacterium goodii]